MTILNITALSETKTSYEQHPQPVRPYFSMHDEAFSLDGKQAKPGLYYHGYNGKSKQVSYDAWVCDPIHVIAKTYHKQQASWGILLKFINRAGEWCEWIIPVQLIRSRGPKLYGLLLDIGLYIAHDGYARLKSWLCDAQPQKCITLTSHTGWHNRNNDTWVFVLPQRVIGSDTHRFQSDDDYDIDSAHHTLGTFEAWQAQVATLCQDNPMLLFVMSIAFVGPLLKRMNELQVERGLKFHLLRELGTTSTFALQMAASVWHAPSIVRSWYTGFYDLELTAATFNDNLLIFDDIDEHELLEIRKTLYTLCLRLGKAKPKTKYSSMTKQSPPWCGVWLSSGEPCLSINQLKEQALLKPERQAHLLYLPVMNHLLFANLHAHKDHHAFIDALGQSCRQHHGHAGIAFIEHLLADKRDFNTLHAKMDSLPQLVALKYKDRRIVNMFTLVAMAGELAIEYKILPWAPGSVIEATGIVYQTRCNLFDSFG